MKSIVSLSALALLVSSPALSAPKSIVCSTGKLGNDNFQQIEIKKTGVEFQFHETFFDVKTRDLAKSGNSISILNKKVKGMAEGDAFTETVDSLLVYNPAKKTLFVSLLLSGFANVPGETFDCK